MFFYMFKMGVNLITILPNKLHCIINMFTAPSINDDIDFHEFVGRVSRDLISNVYDKENIDFAKVKQKTYNVDEESIEICDDNFLYIDKINKKVFHFLYLDGSVFAEPIPFPNLIYFVESHLVSSYKWNFYLEDDNLSVSHYLKKGTNKGANNEENKKEQQLADKEKQVVDIEESDVSLASSVDSARDSEEDSDTSDIKEAQQVTKTTIKIPKEEVKLYWDSRPTVRRKFVAGICGAKWPQLYKSPCCVVMGYIYIRLVGSQKRMSNFGNLKRNLQNMSRRAHL